VDELIASGASSPTPNRETTNGRDSGISPVPEGPVPIGSLIFADELPDGVVVADEAGRVVVFNRVAARLTGLDPAEVIGKFVFDVLPLRDSEGRDWWVYADPYHGLPTRTRHPEQSLYLADGTEVLVSVGYVREPKRVRGACPPPEGNERAGSPSPGGSGGMGLSPGGSGGMSLSPGRSRGMGLSQRGSGGMGPPGRKTMGGPGGIVPPGQHSLGGVVPPGLAVQKLVISVRGAQQRERLERSRAELVSTVAHELRSPLTSVKGFTATLLSKWGRFTDDQKRVMLETVNADADRVTRLITELLDVSRIESGRMEVHRELVDLPDRARKIIAGRVAAGDAEDRFRLEARGGLPETWLDADKIDQILGNLVENAVRHGAGTVTIVVEPAHAGGDEPSSRPGGEPGAADAIAVSVLDQGEGIAPDVAPRVFRQFWRGKPRGGSRTSRHGGGTGLGLYIVKGLVEAHGGTIGVRCAPGGGAEFRFTVPAGAATA
jgi:PAS domain S-box-containing protein